MAAIGVGVFSLRNMIAAISRSKSAWNFTVSFCEQVMLAKEMAGRDQEWYRTLPVCQTRNGPGALVYSDISE